MTSSIETSNSPISLYLPHAQGGAFPWRVLQERQRVGMFATQDEALRFALRLADGIHRHQGVQVRLRFEDDTGGWDTVVAYPGSENVAVSGPL